jgi:hypothetical protein
MHAEQPAAILGGMAGAGASGPGDASEEGGPCRGKPAAVSGKTIMPVHWDKPGLVRSSVRLAGAAADEEEPCGDP